MLIVLLGEWMESSAVTRHGTFIRCPTLCVLYFIRQLVGNSLLIYIWPTSVYTLSGVMLGLYFCCVALHLEMLYLISVCHVSVSSSRCGSLSCTQDCPDHITGTFTMRHNDAMLTSIGTFAICRAQIIRQGGRARLCYSDEHPGRSC